MTSTINIEAKKAAAQPLVELFELDTRPCDPVNGMVYYFTPMTQYVGPHTGQPEQYVRFGGRTYMPFPIQASGWDYTFDGAPAKPKLIVSNTNKFLQAAVNNLGDLVGAKLIRTRTFMNFLDGQPDADPGQHFPKDIFYVDQKTIHNKNVIEWALISSVERGGIQLPLRQILPSTGFEGVGGLRLK